MDAARSHPARATNRPRRVTVQLVDSPSALRADASSWKGPMSGSRTEGGKHASDLKSGTAATERKRIVGAVPHGVERPGSHRERIARAQKLSRLARKHQPGAGGAREHMPGVKERPRSFSACGLSYSRGHSVSRILHRRRAEKPGADWK